jgi:hypothetical protein
LIGLYGNGRRSRVQGDGRVEGDHEVAGVKAGDGDDIGTGDYGGGGGVEEDVHRFCPPGAWGAAVDARYFYAVDKPCLARFNVEVIRALGIIGIILRLEIL